MRHLLRRRTAGRAASLTGFLCINAPAQASVAHRYELPEAFHVAVEVYDVLGRQVATLVDGKQEAGRKQIPFDASGLSAGIYVYRLQAGDYVETWRMVRIR